MGYTLTMPKRSIRTSFFVALLAAVLLVPLPAAAIFVPFGGKVANVVPCTAGFHVTISSARVPGLTEFYIWTPATFTFLHGVPRRGVNILGTADIPFVCFTFASKPIPLYGQRMFVVGTGLVGGFSGGSGGAVGDPTNIHSLY
jgi:hypothetical protein